MNPTRTTPAFSRARDTVEALRFGCGAPCRWVLRTLVAPVAAALAALPRVQLSETVRAAGTVRPEEEPVAVRAPAAGLIAAVFVHDRGADDSNQPLFEIAVPEIDERRRHLATPAAELNVLLAGLAGLTAGLVAMAAAAEPARPIAASCAIPRRTALYERERAPLTATLGAADTERRRLVRELDRVERLGARGPVTERELDAARFALAQRDADDGAPARQTLARWQAAQRLHERERDAVRAEERTLMEAKARRTVRAAVAGDVPGYAGGQPGVFVSEGQSLGMISPGGALRLEAAVRPRDLAHLVEGLRERVAIESLPATEFGSLNATVAVVSWHVECRGLWVQSNTHGNGSRSRSTRRRVERRCGSEHGVVPSACQRGQIDLGHDEGGQLGVGGRREDFRAARGGIRCAEERHGGIADETIGAGQDAVGDRRSGDDLRERAGPAGDERFAERRAELAVVVVQRATRRRECADHRPAQDQFFREAQPNPPPTREVAAYGQQRRDRLGPDFRQMLRPQTVITREAPLATVAVVERQPGAVHQSADHVGTDDALGRPAVHTADAAVLFKPAHGARAHAEESVLPLPEHDDGAGERAGTRWDLSIECRAGPCVRAVGTQQRHGHEVRPDADGSPQMGRRGFGAVARGAGRRTGSQGC